MNKSKFKLKTVLLVITFTVLLLCAILNLSTVWSGVRKFFSLIAPVTLGLCFAYAMNILMRPLEEKVFFFMKRSKRKIIRAAVRPLCLVLTILIVLSLITVLIAVVLPGLHDAVLTLAAKLPEYFNDLKAWVLDIMTRLEMDTALVEEFTVDWKKITNTVLSFFEKADGTAILGTATSAASSLAGGVVNTIFSIVIAIYFLAQKERICAFMRRLTTAFLPEKASRRIFHITELSNGIFSNFIRGQCTEAVILGLLCYIGMQIFRFEYAEIISIMVGVTAIVPIVGAVVGEVFGAFLLLTVSPLRALIFLVFVLVLQQLEGSLIYPKVVGTSVGLPGIIVFSAVLIGGNIGGILGALLAVPVCAVGYSVLRETMEKRQAAKARALADVTNEETDTGAGA